MKRHWLVALILLGSCGPRTGQTPTEQAPLSRLEQGVKGPLLLTLDAPVAGLEDLALVMREFSRVPVEVYVVWQCPTEPTDAWLEQIPGKGVRQFWDPQKKTPSTGGRLSIQGKPVALERVALRVALAQFSAIPR